MNQYASFGLVKRFASNEMGLIAIDQALCSNSRSVGVGHPRLALPSRDPTAAPPCQLRSAALSPAVVVIRVRC
jgi:hypothetical protein